MDRTDFIRRMELAATNNGDDTEARERVKSRLSQDRNPQTAISTGSWVDWDSAQIALGQPWDANKIPLSKLERMRRDPILAFGLMFCKVPLVRAPWYIKCSDPRIASAVDGALREIYGRFILAYTNSFDFGFSPMVKRFKLEDKPDWVYTPSEDPNADEIPVWTDNVVKPIVWKPFTALNPRKCTPHWNSKKEFNGIDFKTISGAPVGGGFGNSGWAADFNNPFGIPQKRLPDVPLDWALWATNERDSEYDSLWGYPRIGHAYRFWWEYWYRFDVASRAFEKWGDPPVIVYHPNDPFDKTVNYTGEALALAESIRSGANAALPSSVVESSAMDRTTNIREWEIKQIETTVDFSSTTEMFEYLDVQKLRAVLVPEQALIEGKGGTSSRNVASEMGDLFQESMAVVKLQIDDHLNRWVIPQFVELNFGADAAKARIVTRGFDPVDLDTMREVMRLIGQRKLLSMIDERKTFDILGVPVVTQSEANKRLAQIAVEAETEITPPLVASEDGAAGVNEQGKYFAPREQVVVNTGRMPFVIKVVDKLPDANSKAHLDLSTNVMSVLENADMDDLTDCLVSSVIKPDGTLPEKDDPRWDVLFAQLSSLESKVNRQVNDKVQVQSGNRTVTQKVLRDDNGKLIGFQTETEVDDGEE